MGFFKKIIGAAAVAGAAVGGALYVKNKKDIYTMIDSIANHRFTELKKYVTTYNKNIDV